MTRRIFTEVAALGDYDDLPKSHEMGWTMCEHCNNLHIVLKDRKRVPFATATLDEAMLVDMLQMVRGARSN